MPRKIDFVLRARSIVRSEVLISQPSSPRSWCQASRCWTSLFSAWLRAFWKSSLTSTPPPSGVKTKFLPTFLTWGSSFASSSSSTS